MNDTQEELDQILLKHEKNRFTFGDILNRKYTREAIQSYVATKELEARRDELQLLWAHLKSVKLEDITDADRIASYGKARLAELTSLDIKQEEK